MHGFNCLLMTVLLVVFILVTGVPSFNYWDNNLSPFWFQITCSLLLLSGLISLLLTHQLDRPWLPEKPEPEEVQCIEEVRNDGMGRGQNQPEKVSKQSLCCRIGSCLATGLLVLLPCILSLIVFASVQEQSPYLLLVHNNAGSETTVSLSILSGLAIHSPSSGDLSTTSGPASTDCSFIGTGSNLRGAILLVNSTKLACLVLLSSGKLVEEASKVAILFVALNCTIAHVQAGCKAVVLLDNTPPEQWRVSSPLSSSSTALAASSQGETPVLMIREADWRRADTQVAFKCE